MGAQQKVINVYPGREAEAREVDLFGPLCVYCGPISGANFPLNFKACVSCQAWLDRNAITVGGRRG